MSISHSRRKSKGTAAERELIHKFWSVGWAAVRVAGSGSSQFPSPDLLVGNNIRKIALEVKATKDAKKYFPKEEINNLKYFSEKFGAEPWVVIKWDREQFFFISLDDLEETAASFVASLDMAKIKGLSFEDLTTF
ncbi:MAG: Holliday junction resolvase Hjc [Nanoarchaeota archaeon]|nr:Holliday junction resolvase [Nanoarchaeota archaeon]MBU1030001.1 Holliday junction resolvase [Nanoarchaeota archaeon]MBU1850187.1 Holliday junction resolvase [Nanoarchaeota archaeon]